MWSIFSFFKPKEDKKEWLEELFENIERIKKQQLVVPFQIINIRKGGFVIKVKGIQGFVPFSLMPWQYNNQKNWEAILFSLKERFLDGVVCEIERYEDPMKMARIIVDATVNPIKKVKLVHDNEYVGIVVQKTEYGVFVDIGYHYDWECGSLVGLLHHSKVSDVESIINCEIGDVITSTFLGYTEKGISLKEVRYKCLEEKYTGKTVPVTVIKSSGCALKLKVENKFIAELPVKNAIYGRNWVLIQKAVSMLKDGDIIHCEVLKLTKKTLFVLKFLPQNDILKATKKYIDELRLYIGKAVKVRAIKNENGSMDFLVNNQCNAILPLTKSFYGDDLDRIKATVEKFDDGFIFDGIVERIDILTEVFTVKYLYPRNVNEYIGKTISLDYAKEQALVVSFKIIAAKSSGLIVKVSQYHAFIPYTLMPWNYDPVEKWEIVMFSLKESVFYGVVNRLERSEDGKYITRFFLDASKMPLKEASLTCNEKYAGIVIQKAKYGVLVDIGHHFQWACGSIVGFLHHTKFPVREAYDSVATGDLVDVNYWHTSEKGIEFIHVEYVDLEAKYAGKTVQVRAVKKENGKTAFLVDDKYQAFFPLVGSIYKKDLKIVKRIIENCPDNMLIECAVQSIDYIFKSFTVIYLYDENLHDNHYSDAKESPEKVALDNNTVYAGVVFNKLDYGLFVDIGYHFEWKYGSIEGLLHRSKFSGTEGLAKCEIGDIISVCFIEKNEKGRYFKEAGYVSLKELYKGKIIQVVALKNKYIDLTARVEDKYMGMFPVTSEVYGANKKAIKEIMQSLPDGAIVNCKVLHVTPSELFMLQLLPQLDEQNEVVEKREGTSEEDIEKAVISEEFVEVEPTVIQHSEDSMPDANHVETDELTHFESIKEQARAVPFKIIDFMQSGFLIEMEGFYGALPLANMPWQYNTIKKWNAILFSLQQTDFAGTVVQIDKSTDGKKMNRFVVEANKIASNEGALVSDETYNGIIIQKTSKGVYVDIGCHFEWKYGSITGFLNYIHCYDYGSLNKCKPGDIIQVQLLLADKRPLSFKDPRFDEYIGKKNQAKNR